MAALVTKPPDELCASFFVHPPSKAIECAICTNVMRDSCVACPKNHSFCRGCITKWKGRSTQCPRCKGELLDELNSNVDLAGVIDETVVYCFSRGGRPADEENEEDDELEASGSASESAASGKRKAATSGGSGAKEAKVDECQWTGPLAQAPAHFAVCDYAGAMCKHAGCGRVVRRSALEAHEEGCCDYQLQQCKWTGCGVDVPRATKRLHEQSCRKRLVPCSRQGCEAASMCFDALAGHLRDECLLEEVACPYEPMGCPARMLRKDVEAHEDAAYKQHNRLLLAKVARQEEHAAEQRKRMQTEIDGLKDEVRTLQEQTDDAGEISTVIELKVKHAQLTGAEPFVLRYTDSPTLIYSRARVLDGCTWRLFVETKDDDDEDESDHYGLYLVLGEGPVPCKVRYIMELVCPSSFRNRPGLGVNESGECTFHDIYEPEGKKRFVPKADLADAATSPYVKNGYVTFKCTFYVVAPIRERIQRQQGQIAGLQRALNHVTGGEVIVLKVKHTHLTGAEPFVPRYPDDPTYIYSEDRVLDGRRFGLFVETHDARFPDHYGLYLEIFDGPVPFKVKRTMELVHHDGQAASAVTHSEDFTCEIHGPYGVDELVPKADFASAATSPYVKDGYVSFKCTFEIVA